MSIDFTKPVKTDNYDTGLLLAIRAHIVSLACMLEPTDAGTVTNPPTGARRFNGATGLFERYGGATWAEQSTGYLKSATAVTTYALQATTLTAGTGLSGGGSLAANRTISLANTAVVAGTYGGNNSIPSLVVDAQGRVTSASVVTPSGTWGISISGSAASAAAATLATKASTLSQSGGTGAAMTFNWSGQPGQPSWLWGSNDGTNIYVYNPSNFSVAYAATAGAVTTANNYQMAALGVGTSNGTAGSIYATANITAYSDRRLKRDVRVIGDALARVAALRGVTYERIDLDDGRRHTGLIAQELQAVLPEAVWPADDGTLTVAYGNVVGLLIEAIKALDFKVAALEARA